MTWKNNSGIYTVQTTAVKSPIELRREMADLEQRIKAEKSRRARKTA